MEGRRPRKPSIIAGVSPEAVRVRVRARARLRLRLRLRVTV